VTTTPTPPAAPKTPPTPTAPGPKFLVIHGHFYQPPRENPWTGRVDRQESAHPHHDWNERVTAQCYGPNATSRILSGGGQIDRIVNNYELMSFNIGPTLFSWLEDERPEVARRIVAADAVSRQRLDGCGNAMAQVHGHLIMPLADEQDRATQLAWGKADFQHRFGRAPAGIWLAETAIDRKTADAVIEAGFQFVILSPFQAEKVRPVAGGEWIDVSATLPDPSMPYLLRHSSASETRSLAVFFYHADLSKSIAFEGLLKDATRFAQRIGATFGEEKARARVITLATDGESYGHHEPFGDMCLAALTRLKLHQMGIAPVNPEYVLRHIKPTFEVQLKAGERGLGTAWSCAHGVGRWMRNCGCRIGGPSHWTQKWREPLREGLDQLGAELKRIYFAFASRYFKDAWEARNAYIEVLLDGRTQAARERFLSEHLKKEAGEHTCEELLRLLESQANAMAMFTSCAWFFDDVSGLEPVQNLRYAARAIQLAGHHTKHNLHELLCEHLRRARSNIAEHRDGEHIYRSWVMPAIMDAPRLAARAVLVADALQPQLVARTVRSELFDTEGHAAREAAEGGQVQVTDRVSGHVERFRYELVDEEPIGRLVRIHLDGGRKPHEYLWKHFDRDVQEALVSRMVRPRAHRADQQTVKAFREHLPVMHALHEVALPAPPVLMAVARRALESTIEEAVLKMETSTRTHREQLAKIRDAYLQWKALWVDPRGVANTPLMIPRELSRLLSRMLTGTLDRVNAHLLRHEEEEDVLEAALDEAWAILDLEHDFGLWVDRFEAENRMYQMITVELTVWLDALKQRGGIPETARKLARELVELAARFNFSMAAVQAQLSRLGA
jgi:alpha-amylase/alpha-mannosidase (GH57 family)